MHFIATYQVHNTPPILFCTTRRSCSLPYVSITKVSGCGEKKVHISWSRVKPGKKTTLVTGTTLKTTVPQDRFGGPVPRQPAHIHHTQAESGAYLRDSSRVPRRRLYICFKPPYVFTYTRLIYVYTVDLCMFVCTYGNTYRTIYGSTG